MFIHRNCVMRETVLPELKIPRQYYKVMLNKLMMSFANQTTNTTINIHQKKPCKI